MNSFDARVRYTKMIIEKNFLELLRKKPVSKITVTELCNAAQINRATFYKHYQDVPQLLEKIEENLFDQIRTVFQIPPVRIEDYLRDMLAYTQRESEHFMVLGSDNGDPQLLTKTFMICYESVFPILSKNLPGMEENELTLLYHFLSHGSGGVLTGWIKGGMKESPEKVAQMIMKLCSAAADSMKK